jgi:folate-binding protein YgfZ
MSKTALTDKFSAAGARIGEYCGAETALSFGNTRAEFEALRSASAVYDLGWRSKIIASGKDCVRWLNGMITNNIRDLQPGHGNYNFLLTPQGRIQGDLYAYNRGDYLMLGTERSQAPNILERLKKYIIMDKVELEDVSDRLTAIGLQGPKSREILFAFVAPAAVAPAPPPAGPVPASVAPDSSPAGPVGSCTVHHVAPMQVADFVWNGIGLSITRMANESFLTYEIWVSMEKAATVWDALVAAGATPAGTDALELFRVAAGIPRYGLDIRERDLPQETAQEQALNFNKGCYIGQEIVERVRARGAVHRTLAGFTLDGNAPPAPGTKISFNGKEVGEVTSALAVPSTAGGAPSLRSKGGVVRMLALGIIRREASKTGTHVSIGEAAATVATLPFPEANPQNEI